VVEVKTGSRSTAHWSIDFVRLNEWLRHSFTLLITPLDIDGIGQNWEDSRGLQAYFLSVYARSFFGYLRGCVRNFDGGDLLYPHHEAQKYTLFLVTTDVFAIYPILKFWIDNTRTVRSRPYDSHSPSALSCVEVNNQEDAPWQPRAWPHASTRGAA